MIKKNSIYFIIVLVLFFFCCSDKNAKRKEIEQIPINFEIIRFDSLFFESSANQLHKLKKDFPYFFPENTPDSIWKNKKKDTIQQELYQEVKKHFPSLKEEEKQIKWVFQNVKHHFKGFNPPKVIALTTDVMYNSRMVYADSLLFLGLDNYLGKKHRFYDMISQYIRYSFEKKFISTDVAMAISSEIVKPRELYTFLDNMVYEGKKIYLSKQFLPDVDLVDIFKMPQQKYAWVQENQSQIWRYFIENKLLYDTDKKTLNRFIDPAPFSKFYMEHDSESPGGVGRYIGYKIVEAYMKNHTIEQMLNEKEISLFEKSGYKPKK